MINNSNAIVAGIGKNSYVGYNDVIDNGQCSVIRNLIKGNIVESTIEERIGRKYKGVTTSRRDCGIKRIGSERAWSLVTIQGRPKAFNIVNMMYKKYVLREDKSVTDKVVRYNINYIGNFDDMVRLGCGSFMKMHEDTKEEYEHDVRQEQCTQITVSGIRFNSTKNRIGTH